MTHPARDEPSSPATVRTTLPSQHRRTAHEAAREELRHAILSGDLAPGTPLVLADLADQLGMSRTPVREAIRDLVTEGLIDFDAYRSAVVHVPTVEEAREIYELRIVLEGMAVRSALADIGPGALDRAAALCDAMEHTADTAEWAELNRQFHAALLESVGSRRLRALVATLRDASAAQVALSIRAGGIHVEQANREHRAILDAFRDHDEESAVAHQTQHLRTTLASIESFAEPRAQRARDVIRS